MIEKACCQEYEVAVLVPFTTMKLVLDSNKPKATYIPTNDRMNKSILESVIP